MASSQAPLAGNPTAGRHRLSATARAAPRLRSQCRQSHPASRVYEGDGRGHGHVEDFRDHRGRQISARLHAAQQSESTAGEPLRRKAPDQLGCERLSLISGRSAHGGSRFEAETLAWGAEEPVPGVPQPGEDVSPLVQLLV